MAFFFVASPLFFALLYGILRIPPVYFDALFFKNW